MAEVKPKWPSCEGEQYDENSQYLDVRYDGAGNEIPTDKPMHGNATPGEGKPNYGGNQYATPRSYGVEVAPPSVGGDRGGIDVSRNGRGRES